MSWESKQFKEKLTYEFQIQEQIRKCRDAFSNDARKAIIELRVLEEMLYPYYTQETLQRLQELNNILQSDEIELLELLFLKFRTIITFLDEKGLLLEKEEKLEI